MRGAAIVTALLVVALVTVIVSSLFYRESVATRSIENRATLSQTKWIERAVIDWAKVILQNTRAAYDWSGSLWATPVVETQLDETVTGGAKVGDASRQVFLAGRIHDAQSRFNINALLQYGQTLGTNQSTSTDGGGLSNEKGDGSASGSTGTGGTTGSNGSSDPYPVSTKHVEAAKRLMGILSLPESLVDQLVLRLKRVAAQNAGKSSSGSWVMPLTRLEDLLDLAGFNEEVLQKLEPHVTILPADARTVNVNSASVEVLTAVAPTWGEATIRSFVAHRDVAPAESLSAANLRLGTETTLDQTLVAVKSVYFLAEGIIRYDRVESSTETLLKRADAGPVQVIWQHRN